MLLVRISWAHTNVFAKLDTLEMAANALVSTEVCFKHLPNFGPFLRKLTDLIFCAEFLYRLKKGVVC